MAKIEFSHPALHYCPALHVPAADRINEICYQMHHWSRHTRSKAK